LYEQWIDAQDRQIFHDCLCNQQAIKWILVVMG